MAEWSSHGNARTTLLSGSRNTAVAHMTLSGPVLALLLCHLCHNRSDKGTTLAPLSRNFQLEGEKASSLGYFGEQPSLSIRTAKHLTVSGAATTPNARLLDRNSFPPPFHDQHCQLIQGCSPHRMQGQMAIAEMAPQWLGIGV